MADVNRAKKLVLGVQHVFAMFGATVLMPALTGMDPGVALLAAGIGTFVFHGVTGGIVPVFLGSSFAFIGAIKTVVGEDGSGLPKALGGVICAGLFYLLFSLVVKFGGAKLMKRLFPAVVTGPVIMVIGLSLAPIGVEMASSDWLLSLVAIFTIIAVSCFMKGFFKLVPILIGILTGYLVAAILGRVDYSALQASGGVFIGADSFVFPVFDWTAILAIAPLAIVTSMEHIGDITTNGAVVGKDFFKKPGLHRTLLGDGLATVASGLIGGPPNTTYSENTGVLAVTKNYDPAVLRLAAAMAIGLGLFSPVGAFLRTIPVPVMGGVSFILFGMIASVGIRTIANAQLNFNRSRNLIIVALILVCGLGGVKLPLGELVIEGIGLAAMVGMLANLVLHLILPDDPNDD
ncbi:uracil-xanthine permease [Pelagicoccus sp. NFK12]|uniref:Uracil-xanthine permease n=1 Tax=Pelagicoccus enzymogenes TaxID=2773457 RepID=A0A927IGZ9_9BACT|nr:uracil-xanthine permease family protein [Pelagicoccus enzymogenes]MBD5779203.1 uracil-xanthine permease [Pelagicoccus enzymogenes]MDQ8198445.1 uracil-xanthine permease family protein [Pelagicoccus enzymogenes]